jgi:hypothetical protein
MALTDVNLFRIDGSTGSIGTASIDNIKNSAAPGNNIILNSDGTTTLTPSNIIKSGTAVASTSGTFVDFTGIPSWVKRVTVMLVGVSTNGSSNLLVQLGAGSITTSGYTGQGVQTTSAPSISNTTSTTGLILTGAFSATALYSGACQIISVSGNTWANSGTLLSGTAGNANFFSGSVTLSDTLDRIRITTVNGTDTFDAGTINILFEG